MRQHTRTTRRNLHGSGAVLGFALCCASPVLAQIRFEGNEALAGGFNIHGVATADVDADGDLDILSPTITASSIYLLRNLGAGGFAPRAPIFVGAPTKALVAADFTGDGFVDVLALTDVAGLLVFLRNTGTGSFDPPTSIACSLTQLEVKAADLDSDGDMDFVVIYQAYPGVPTLSVHMNQGFGTFAAPVLLSLGGDADQFDLGDLDGDGAVDMALSGSWLNAIQYLRNQGSGTFDPPVPVASAGGFMVMADLDGDSDLDLTLCGGQIWFFANQGNATFAPQVVFTTPTGIHATRSGDIDGDGDLDLVATGSGYPSALLTFTNQGAGVFAYSAQQPTAYVPNSLELADMDGDSDLDFVVPSSLGGTVTVHSNHGDGTYSQPDTIPDGYAHARQVAAADLDGNDAPDLVVAAGGLQVVLGQGNGTFSAPVFYDIPGNQTWSTAADLDGDGDQDVVTANGSQNNVAVLLNQGNGVLSLPSFYAVGSNPLCVAAADLDGDGDQDLVAADAGSNDVGVLINTGSGTFGASSNFAVGASPYAVRCADLDGDGDLDIASVNFIGASVTVLRNLGGGSFSTFATLTAGTRPSAITSGDLDGDGDIDLAVCNRGYTDIYTYTVSVYQNSGSGTFTTSTYPVGALPLAIDCAELDGAPGLELFTANSFGDTVSVLRNLGNGTFASHREFVAGTLPQGVVALDVDDDGDLEIVAARLYAASLPILRNVVTSGTPYCAGDGSTVPCPCGNQSAVGARAGCANSSGAAGMLRGSGSALVSDDELGLFAQGLTGSVALFFQGTSENPPAVIDDGIGCVGGSIVRLGTKPVSAGTTSYPLPGDPLIHVRGAVPADGGTRYYQCFYRNAVAAFCPPATSNRTNALRLVWRP